MPRARTSRDQGRAARRFYDRFTAERAALVASVRGIEPVGDRERYAALTLNRLMLLAFIQARGFLDGNPGYLRAGWVEHQARAAQRRQPSFFRDCLLPLFHRLGRLAGAPAPAPIVGLPRLGGPFALQPLERSYPDTNLDDAACARLLDFVDDFDWCLEDRPPAGERAITPSVLGDVLEQCVNQKELGAYYTGDDVTAYIGAATIVPALFDAVERRCPKAFRADGPIWRLPRRDPNRYIRADLLKGVDLPLPQALEAAGGDSRWSDAIHRPADDTYALPTETWREHLARRARCRELRGRLAAGEIRSADDFVTANLDLGRLALDALACCDDPELLDAFWQALQQLSVLDPTCGSGAFLLGALRVLAPLREACLDRGRALAARSAVGGELERADRCSLPPATGQLGRPGVMRSILLDNLYGLDLMDEAVEMCKLRLYLALLTRVERIEQLEPLPDLDGNLRTGDVFDPAAAFPERVRAGGFDVVIGNPPYIPRRGACSPGVAGYQTRDAPDVYAQVLERTTELLGPWGRTGMVVPLSLTFGRGFDSTRRLLLAAYRRNWFASFARIPAALFGIHVRIRNTIHLGAKAPGAAPRTYTTRLHRWFREQRPTLFSTLAYAAFDPAAHRLTIPRLPSDAVAAAFGARSMAGSPRLRAALSPHPTPHLLHFKHVIYNWLTCSRRLPPCLDRAGRPIAQPGFGRLHFATAAARDLAFLLLNGKLAFAYWCAIGDDFHVTYPNLEDFPVDLAALERGFTEDSEAMARELEAAMEREVVFKLNAGKRIGNYNLARCRAVTDRSDAIFARLLGLEAVWPEIELFCAQMVRTDFYETAAGVESLPGYPAASPRGGFARTGSQG